MTSRLLSVVVPFLAGAIVTLAAIRAGRELLKP